MRAQSALLRARQPPVELAGDRKLRLAARERRLELLAQRAPRTEDQRLHRARRQLEDLCDLRVRASLELAHHERGALVERQVAERAANVLGARAFLLIGSADQAVADVLVERNLLRPARG